MQEQIEKNREKSTRRRPTRKKPFSPPKIARKAGADRTFSPPPGVRTPIFCFNRLFIWESSPPCQICVHNPTQKPRFARHRPPPIKDLPAVCRALQDLVSRVARGYRRPYFVFHTVFALFRLICAVVVASFPHFIGYSALLFFYHVSSPPLYPLFKSFQIPPLLPQNLFLEKHFTFEKSCAILIKHQNGHLPVAQLDSASDSDSEGRRFESCRVGQNRGVPRKGDAPVLVYPPDEPAAAPRAASRSSLPRKLASEPLAAR